MQYSNSRQMDRAYTRLRLGQNGLKANNQCYNEMDPLCPHCEDIEDTSFYFLHCTKHKEHKDKLIEDINNIPDQRNTDLSVKLLLSKKISNDQEPTQSDPTSCPQNQKGNN